MSKSVFCLSDNENQAERIVHDLKSAGFVGGARLEESYMELSSKMLKNQRGAIGWVLLWAIGIPIPILVILFMVRGCT